MDKRMSLPKQTERSGHHRHTTYYDRIADRWEAISGDQGGAFRRFVLNDRLLSQIGDIGGLRVLELGAGNGNLMRLVSRRQSGRPARVVITDVSRRLLAIAQRKRRVSRAEYRALDVSHEFPFADEDFDIVVAVMLLNELRDDVLERALLESHRVLRPEGRMVGAVLHPRFVASLGRRGQLRRGRFVTMPTSGGLRVPVVQRSVDSYCALFEGAGFQTTFSDVSATPEVLRRKPGLANAGALPIAMLFEGIRRPR
ncbi:MAG: class I SAM-dependent methyltransferase [Armatimonadota bacterium]